MPSPRPTGSGALKILLLPQLLEHHIFYFVTLSGDPVKPILGLLLGVASICYGSCHLNRFFLFVIVVRLCGTSFTATGLIPAVLRAVASSVSLLSTDVAGDVCEVGSPTSSYKSSSWRGYTAPSPSSSSARYERVVGLVLGSLSDAGTRSVRRRIHGVGVPHWDLERALASIGTSRGTFELI